MSIKLYFFVVVRVGGAEIIYPQPIYPNPALVYRRFEEFEWVLNECGTVLNESQTNLREHRKVN